MSRRSYGTLCALTSLTVISALLAFVYIEPRVEAQRLGTPSLRESRAAIMAGTITGRVFRDYNSNGTYDTSGGTTAAPTAVDAGVQSVTVSAYDAAGALRGSATTAADGTYSLAATGTGPYRIEFTNLPAGYTASSRSTDSVQGGTASNAGSTVQFVLDGATSNVNLAINRRQDHCEDNPAICSQLYGVGAAPQPDGVFTVPYTAGSTRTTGGLPVADFQSPGNTSLAQTDEVGTTFGIAYHRNQRKIFVSAYMKKHAAFGPGGTGAIYAIDRNTNAVSEYVNLNTIFGANTAGVDSHNYGDFVTDGGQATWNAVGKVAFGGMAISDDEANIFVMNLANRRLYRIPTSGPLNSTTIQSVAFPATMPDCTTAGDVRPFAVTWHEGTVYVGAVCSREDVTFADPSANLRGYVYSLNPGTLTFSAAPLLNIQLNYSRAETDPGLAARWRNWRSTYATISGSHFIYPQPMLTDIEFDNGNLILSLRDRNGDQAGYNSASNPGNTGQLFKGITAGDILRACGSPALGWTLESNGRCASIGSAPQNTGEGPGNGEYYYQDNYHPNGNPHDEVGVGAAMQIPGHREMVATVFDPVYIPTDNVYDAGGFRWFNNSTGAQQRGYLAFWMEDFGKANGMGNVQALCEAAPIEIGNRVWFDTNVNGVQDPGEAGVAGVTVRLYSGPALVGTAITDANGEYYFVSSSTPDANPLDHIGQVNGGVRPSTAYQIRLDNPGNFSGLGALWGYALTMPNETSQLGNDDASDSDAVTVANPAGSPSAGTFPVISLTTGLSGANDHSFDFGFAAIPSAAPSRVSGRVVTASGVGIRNAIVTLTEADGTVHVRATGTFGYYHFTGIASGQSVLIDIKAKRFTFSVPTRMIEVMEDLENADFVADEW